MGDNFAKQILICCTPQALLACHSGETVRIMACTCGPCQASAFSHHTNSPDTFLSVQTEGEKGFLPPALAFIKYPDLYTLQTAV